MLATIYESPGSSPPLGTTATHHAFQYDPFARQIHAISSTNAGRSDRRGTSSPDIITVTEPPPNPYADNKIPAEKKLFLKLLARRLRVTQRADRGMTVERAAEFAWSRFAWIKRHLWVEALRPVDNRPKTLRNPDGLIGEPLCEAYLDVWALEGDSVLKLPKGVEVVFGGILR